MKKETPLTPEQQKQVAELMPYVKRIARAMARDPQDRDDYTSAAALAACLAVRSWNPDKNKSLKAWVRRYVITYINIEYLFTRCPVTISSSEKDVSRYIAAHVAGEPDLEKMERAAVDQFPDSSPDDIETAAWFAIGRGLGQPHGYRRGGEQAAVYRHAATTPHPESLLEIRDRFRAWYRTLTPRFQTTAAQFFVHGLTLTEIADIEQVSREAIRQRVVALRKSWHEATKNETEKKECKL